MTNQIITNFITNHIENYIELTNIGLNSETLSNLSKASIWEIIIAITSIALCLIPILINCVLWKNNKKLEKKIEEKERKIEKQNKINKFNDIIELYFNIHINDIYKWYASISFKNGEIRDKSLYDAKIEYYINIKKILTSLKIFKNDINKCYSIYFNNLNNINVFLNRIEERKILKEEYGNDFHDKFKNYLTLVLDYCDTMILSINFEINEEQIKEDNINSTYNEIEEIQEELNQKL